MTANAHLPEVTAVIGGGTMGAGIAHVLLEHGSRVTVAEAGSERANLAREAVAASMAKAAERGKLGAAPDALLPNLSTVDSIEALPAEAGLVVEAVPEHLDLKREVIAAVGQVCPHALLATNTSSLSIAAIAEAGPRERVLGMHFFNPVPAQSLVELVVHDKVSEHAKATARRVVEAIGRTAIEVRDYPGFATSRLGVAVGLEAIRMVEDGVASPHDIDTGMTLGYRWPMGPLRLTDLVGLDVRLAIAEHLATELGSRFEPPQLLRDKVARGELGKKTGQGFFPW